MPETIPENLPDLNAIARLVAVVAQLRSPEGGCPWDLAQTPASLTPYIIEEAYETVDAINHGSSAEIKEELGDLLLQVVLQAQIAQENNEFDLNAIAEAIADKLIRRHPHVFGAATVSSIEDVKQSWEVIKTQEQATAQLAPQLAKYGRSLPPLSAATKISKKVAAAGFEWPNLDGVWQKMREEVAELEAAIASGNRDDQEAELGDVLFTVVNLGRWLGLDPVRALQGTNRRFAERWAWVEAHVDTENATETPPDLDTFLQLWQKAKVALAATNSSAIASARVGGSNEG